jgi:hypothetical protein
MVFATDLDIDPSVRQDLRDIALFRTQSREYPAQKQKSLKNPRRQAWNTDLVTGFYTAWEPISTLTGAQYCPTA